MIRRHVPIILLAALAISCGKKNDVTGPSPTPSTPTRVIVLSGNLDFGNVAVGTSATRTFTIANTGNSTLTFTGISVTGGTGTDGWTANPLTGTVAAGSSLQVTLVFTPKANKTYSTTMVLNADQTAGNNAIAISGTGINTGPLFTKTGTGDTVFDMPTSVARVTITADFPHNSSNFIVYIGGRLVVNELVGYAWNAPHFEGTYLVNGGTVEIKNSSAVDWSFTEVR